MRYVVFAHQLVQVACGNAEIQGRILDRERTFQMEKHADELVNARQQLVELDGTPFSPLGICNNLLFIHCYFVLLIQLSEPSPRVLKAFDCKVTMR